MTEAIAKELQEVTEAVARQFKNDCVDKEEDSTIDGADQKAHHSCSIVVMIAMESCFCSF